METRDRKEYYREWYRENKVHKKRKTYQWLRKLKRKLGAEGFREWKRKENEKYKAKKRLKNGRA